MLKEGVEYSNQGRLTVEVIPPGNISPISEPPDEDKPDPIDPKLPECNYINIGNGLGTWSIKIDEIPENLIKKVIIDGDEYNQLNPELIDDIGLILMYTATLR